MLLERLKQETHRHHIGLESLFRLPEKREDYRRSLACLWGYVAPWEAAMERWVGNEAEWQDGRSERTRWLREDLGSLGLGAGEIEKLPRCPAVANLDSLFAALGSWYVWEGSTLGGQYIVRHLEKTLQLNPQKSARFYFGYGSATGLKWTTFRGFLERFSSPETDAAIIAGAVDTFATLHRWTAQQLSHVSER